MTTGRWRRPRPRSVQGWPSGARGDPRIRAGALGINGPIAANARTTFVLHTGAPGTYTWRCLDPCGTGPSGWGGPMSTPGYMEGTLTVVG